jgi:hypothetical protein
MNKQCCQTNSRKDLTMRQTLKRIIRNIKNTSGSSLAEFATTTALMATLAATAAPKLSEMSEGAKAEKSSAEIDKILTQAQNFYQETANLEGRGRFPGQDKYNMAVGGYGSNYDYAMETGVWDALEAWGDGSVTFDKWDHAEGTKWCSVFGINNDDAPQQVGGQVQDDQVLSNCDDCPVSMAGHDEWLRLFGGNTIASQYQDGHFIYVVLPGGGTGLDAFPPILYVADAENPSHFNNFLEP